MNDQPQLDFFLKEMAENHQPQLPSPSLIWWRAQILRKQQQKERIERPMRVMRLVAAVVCLATFLGLLAGNRQLQAVMSHDGALLLPAVVGIAVFLASAVLFFRSPASKT